MKIELTKKEIETVGYNRYMRLKRRMWKALIPMLVMFGVALGLAALTKGWGWTILVFVIILIGFMPFWKLMMDANKAGKRFSEEQEKENK